MVFLAGDNPLEGMPERKRVFTLFEDIPHGLSPRFDAMWAEAGPEVRPIMPLAPPPAANPGLVATPGSTNVPHSHSTQNWDAPAGRTPWPNMRVYLHDQWWANMQVRSSSSPRQLVLTALRT